MNKARFIRGAKSLYRVAQIQRGFKLVLRAAWMGGAGYILGWGAQEIWGVLPDQAHWLVLGGILAAVNLAAIFFPPVSLKEFFWNLDQKMGLDEQISTAAEAEDEANPVNQALFEDAHNLVPKARRRIIDKGWDLRREFESGVVVLILLLVIYLTGIGTLPATVPGGIGVLPGLGTNPTFSDVFPGGVPGDGSGAEFSEGLGGGLAAELSAESIGQIGEVLGELGRDLSDQAGTSDLGRALEQGDWEEAAEQLSELAGKVDQLSAETQENLADSLESAADKLQGTDQQALAEHLGDAADAVRSGERARSGEDLDDLAETLRNLGGLTRERSASEGGLFSGAGPSGSSQPSPFERLEGEGGGIFLEGSESSTYLQTGGAGGGEAGEVVGGSYDYIGPTDGTVIEGEMTPYYLPWIFRDVISSYFTP